MPGGVAVWNPWSDYVDFAEWVCGVAIGIWWSSHQDITSSSAEWCAQTGQGLSISTAPDSHWYWTRPDR